MPLAAPFSAQCPLLTESDFLSLSERFELCTPVLRDTTVGAMHQITPPGEILIAALAASTTYHDLLAVAENNKVPHPAIVDMLGFLNLTGALLRKRQAKGYKLAAQILITGWLTNTRFAPLYWRRKASTKHLLIALLRGSWIVAVAAACVTALIIAGGLASIATGLAVLLSSITLFWVSVYIHELGHWIILQRQHVASDIMQHGFHLALLHPRLDAAHEMQSAIIGPLMGIAPCLIAITVYVALGYLLLAVASGVVALIHLCSFLPWYGDGISLQYALKHRGEI